ncbi:MAG: transcription initiation factor IIB, partial [Microgenomates group bacterium]
MEEIKKCPECESTNLIHDYDTGEIICGNCGLVVRKQMMDEGPEWRAFTDEEKAERSRVGMPISYSVHDKGLSTAIGELDRDASGKKIPLSTREQMWRLKKWQTHSRVHSSTERNLAQAMAEIDRLSDKVSLPPPIKEKAAIIYRKVLEKDLVQGRSILAMAAAALYAACRESKIPRTLREIAKESLVEKKDVARCYRLLLRKLEMQMPIADPVTFVSKIAEKVGISAKTQGLAIEILRKAKEKQISNGKNPNSLAAGALYIACAINNEMKN